MTFLTSAWLAFRLKRPYSEVALEMRLAVQYGRTFSEVAQVCERVGHEFCVPVLVYARLMHVDLFDALRVVEERAALAFRASGWNVVRDPEQ